MGKRFITALLALLLVGVQVFAQSAVSGKVTDETGEPCVGANVLIKGTTTGTMTDLDGNYSLPHVKQGAILVFSSIGYTTQEVKSAPRLSSMLFFRVTTDSSMRLWLSPTVLRKRRM